MGFEIPRVSVICVTNRWSFVYPMLHLFHAQSWPNKELVLLDSSEGGRGIDLALSFGDWMHRSPLTGEERPQFSTRFEYQQVKPGALIPLKRNLGMEMATGEYMTWMDDDGWHDPFRIERMMLKMDEHELDLIGLQGLYWVEPVHDSGVFHYVGTRGMPISGSMVWHRRCAESHSFQQKYRQASDHFWINRLRRDPNIRHGTVNWPEMCVGVSHGLNISNPRRPKATRMTQKDLEDFHGDEPYGLKAHVRRIREALKELKG